MTMVPEGEDAGYQAQQLLTEMLLGNTLTYKATHWMFPFTIKQKCPYFVLTDEAEMPSLSWNRGESEKLDNSIIYFFNFVHANCMYVCSNANLDRKIYVITTLWVWKLLWIDCEDPSQHTIQNPFREQDTRPKMFDSFLDHSGLHHFPEKCLNVARLEKIIHSLTAGEYLLFYFVVKRFDSSHK